MRNREGVRMSEIDLSKLSLHDLVDLEERIKEERDCFASAEYGQNRGMN